MFDYSKLYGKIKEVFNTQEAFADAMEMSRTAVNARLKQNVEWKEKKVSLGNAIIIGAALENQTLRLHFRQCTRNRSLVLTAYLTQFRSRKTVQNSN